HGSYPRLRLSIFLPSLLSLPPPPPRSTLFPYTTLFRSSRFRPAPHCSALPASRPAPAAPEARRSTATPTTSPTAPSGLRCSRSRDRKSTRLNSSHVAISYAVFCLKKKKK